MKAPKITKTPQERLGLLVEISAGMLAGSYDAVSNAWPHPDRIADEAFELLWKLEDLVAQNK
jgi:hypothetical protein